MSRYPLDSMDATHAPGNRALTQFCMVGPLKRRHHSGMVFLVFGHKRPCQAAATVARKIRTPEPGIDAAERTTAFRPALHLELPFTPRATIPHAGESPGDASIPYR
jgi:hypothetical protein